MLHFHSLQMCLHCMGQSSDQCADVALLTWDGIFLGLWGIISYTLSLHAATSASQLLHWGSFALRIGNIWQCLPRDAWRCSLGNRALSHKQVASNCGVTFNVCRLWNQHEFCFWIKKWKPFEFSSLLSYLHTRYCSPEEQIMCLQQSGHVTNTCVT